jgi:hypothetical protein
MKTLYIIRGLPGSGKSTLGVKLADTYMDYHPKFGGTKHYSYAADDWFTDHEGNYNFVPEELSQAHEDCNARVRGAMMSGVENICVCNTFTQAWEAAPYFKLAGDFRYITVVLECQSEFGNIHGCPQEKINEMAGRWESREYFMKGAADD